MPAALGLRPTAALGTIAWLFVALAGSDSCCSVGQARDLCDQRQAAIGTYQVAANGSVGPVANIQKAAVVAQGHACWKEAAAVLRLQGCGCGLV